MINHVLGYREERTTSHRSLKKIWGEKKQIATQKATIVAKENLRTLKKNPLFSKTEKKIALAILGFYICNLYGFLLMKAGGESVKSYCVELKDTMFGKTVSFIIQIAGYMMMICFFLFIISLA